MVVCGNYFAEPDTILVFKIFYGVFGEGTLGSATLLNGYGGQHFSQSPGLELREREEELRRPAMMEWFFPDALC